MSFIKGIRKLADSFCCEIRRLWYDDYEPVFSKFFAIFLVSVTIAVSFGALCILAMLLRYPFILCGVGLFFSVVGIVVYFIVRNGEE